MYARTSSNPPTKATSNTGTGREPSSQQITQQGPRRSPAPTAASRARSSSPAAPQQEQKPQQEQPSSTVSATVLTSFFSAPGGPRLEIGGIRRCTTSSGPHSLVVSTSASGIAAGRSGTARQLESCQVRSARRSVLQGGGATKVLRFQRCLARALCYQCALLFALPSSALCRGCMSNQICQLHLVTLFNLAPNCADACNTILRMP